MRNILSSSDSRGNLEHQEINRETTKHTLQLSEMDLKYYDYPRSCYSLRLDHFSSQSKCAGVCFAVLL